MKLNLGKNQGHVFAGNLARFSSHRTVQLT